MSQNNCLIYFFVDSEGGIRVNHLNNTAEELTESLGYRNEYPLLLFAYSYRDRKLFVTNANQEELIGILESLKKSKEHGLSSSDEKEPVKQLEAASIFLRNKYAWKGEIFSRDDLDSAVSSKSVKDFDIVWKYLSLIFGSMRLDPIDLPVHIVDNLTERSLFIPFGEVIDIGEDVHGPAIIVRKTNSMFFMAEAIIYQYVLNLHGIVDFSPGMEETYLRDAKEFVDQTLISFLRNNDLKDHTFWYVGKKDGRLYLNRNDYVNDSDKLRSTGEYTSVVTFEYASVEDCRYIIVNDISAGDINISELYMDIVEFIQQNLSYIGHIENNGDPLKKLPVYMFEGLKPTYSTLYASNLPVWIYLETVLAPIYDFDPRNILIVRGAFNETFAFKYIDPTNKDDKEYLSEYLFAGDYDEPLILWNTTSYDSIIGKWNQFVKEYMVFIYGNRGPESRNVAKDLKRFQSSVLRSAQNRFAIETLVGLLCEENPHVHQYNIFNVFTKIIGLTGIITEDVLEDNEDFGDEATMELLSEVQTSLFFLTLKAMANFCNIKHGVEFHVDGKIQKGDIIADEKCQCLLEVEAVLLEPNNKTDKNPDGVTYSCRNLICGKHVNKVYGEVKLFHLGFLDAGEYNEKTASKINKQSQQYGEEFYKSMLERFLRNKKRPNPLDYVEEEKETPTFDAYLSMQREDYGRSGGDTILENMLNDCRKVKSYGN